MTLNSNYPPLGRQQATSDTYAAQGLRLAEKLAKTTGSSDPSIIAASFLASANRYSQRTFRLYKAQLIEHMTRHRVAPGVIKVLMDASSKNCTKKGGPGTSGNKAKKISQVDRELLLARLRKSGAATSCLAADYFEAGLLIGPRPAEWAGAELRVISTPRPLDAPATATHLLKLPNAKRDMNGVRGNGDFRLVYASLSAAEAALITRVIADATKNEHSWAAHYNRLRVSLFHAGKMLWPKRAKIPCFYTTRHQAQADAKATGMRLNEIAAIYGHASDNTATSHYARKSSGDKNMCKVAATAVSLARVRNQEATSKHLLRERRNSL
ncbi:hypothetical protein [Paracidovorax wautersii]|uniref:Phage integrase family protein n=1 Tax=Paracidovorax wautersii TaxID=1177982 RepID=A0A1I2HPE1_9BURK|nr:hypothetical protein [Paracidovorax wautersii]SFF31303.1 hypothetical protein SAMN04489711_12618 [Paracidovorax wautersii]